jgi:hypothetical protein
MAARGCTLCPLSWLEASTRGYLVYRVLAVALGPPQERLRISRWGQHPFSLYNPSEFLSWRLEAEGRALAEVVAEHVLLCFCSRDSQVTLEPVLHGLDVETEEAAWASV